MKKFRCANKGFILSSLKARNLMWKSLRKIFGQRPEIIYLFSFYLLSLFLALTQYLYSDFL